MLGKRNTALLLAAVMAAVCLFGCTPAGQADSLRPQSAPPLAVQPWTAGEADAQGFAPAAESDGLILSVNSQNGSFRVRDTAAETDWYSAPPEVEADPVANPAGKMELSSALVIEIFDLEKSDTVRKNSENACVRKKGLTLYRVENGFRADYLFPDYQITVPVEVTLGDGGLTVRVLTAEITEERPERYLLCGLSLLPYFGAAGQGEEGYALLPDGCGALMAFHNGKTKSKYAQPLIGTDMALTLTNRPPNREAATLPVFGVKKGNAAFLTVLTEGAAAASVNAVPNGMNSSYGSVFCSYVLRSDDRYTLDEKNIDAQDVHLYQERERELSACTQRYFFLSGTEADYNGMARRYREYLREEQGVAAVPDESAAVWLDFYAATQKTESVAGFVVKRTETLSTAEAIRAYTEMLQAEGVTASVRLNSWSRDGIRGKVDTALAPVGALGSRKALTALADALAENGGRLTLSTDIVRFEKNGSGLSAYNDSAQTMTGAPAYQYRFLVSTRLKDPDGGRGYLTNPLCFADLAKRLKQAMTAYSGIRLSLYTPANLSYGSYGSELLTREDTEQANRALLKTLSEQTALVLPEPAAYAVGYACVLTDTPLESSGYDVTDETVPFYQLVMSGLRPCTSKAVNLNGNAGEVLLKALVTGTVPAFSLITGESTALIGSPLNGLYSADAQVWADTVLSAAKQAAHIREVTGGSPLFRHDRLTNGVFMLTYENGARILTNTGKTPYQGAEGSVDAGKYLIMEAVE